jgi:PST family polysaccharide transporter
MMVRVLPSFFAAAQKEKEALRAYLLTLVQAISLFILPLSVGLALVADQFVLLVLGAKWMAVVLPLRILLCFTSVRALTNILGPLLNAKRLAHFIMWTNTAAAIYFPIGFLIAARWGTTGIAAAWLVLYPVLAAPLFWRTFREIEIPPVRYLRALLPAVSGSIILSVAVLSLRNFMPAGWSPIFRLSAEIATGGLSYVVGILLLHAKDLRRLYQIVQPNGHTQKGMVQSCI